MYMYNRFKSCTVCPVYAADLVLEGEALEQGGLCVVEPDAVGARARAAQPAAAHSQQPAIVRPINRHVCTM